MDRRQFLQVSMTGGGLLMGFSLLSCKRRRRVAVPQDAAVDLNAWILIAPDDSVVLRIHRAEMGQGVLTALSMILAEELEADWSKVSAEQAPADEDAYGDMTTRLSNSVRDNYFALRQAGAAARQMLIAGAARRWNVDPATCRAERSVIIHESGRRLRYGEVLAHAATVAVPDVVELKSPASFQLIGKPVARLDSPAKLRGETIFGIDVRLPGMLTAVVARCPIFGGSPGKYDADAARAVPGVVDVREIPSGIAVVAEHFWAATRGREALSIEWLPGKGARVSSAEIFRELRGVVEQGKEARRDGDPAALLAASERKLEAVYEFPYLAAAPMEPLGCTADVHADSCDIWVSTQVPVFTQKAAASITGLPLEAVRVHVMPLGGGFGRRKQLDFAVEAVELSRALDAPVQVVWTREDDIRGGHYRPASVNRLVGAVNEEGRPVAWVHQIATPPLPAVFEPTVQDGIDVWAVQGAVDLPYDIPGVQVTYAMPDVPQPPPWFWRAIGSSYTAFATECFLDELCALGGREPLELRLELLEKQPRHRRVLEVAAEKAGWWRSVPSGRARGLAVHGSFGSFCAQVAEVSVEGERVRVHRIVCAIDCGGVVNPDTVVAQMEGSIIYALSAALYGAIDIEDGRAVQSNYHDYRILRLPETPVIETHIIATGEPLGGIGEPALPPTAPAVCNALRMLTGVPVRKLPLMPAPRR